MFSSINPATGHLVSEHEAMRAEAVQHIVKQAFDAQQQWRHTPIAERGRLLRVAAELLLENRQQYAGLMCDEMGKIVKQGVAEIEKCAWVCRHYAEHAEHFLKPETVRTEARHSFVTYNPLGVILAIMPWNFPFWQVFRCAVPALAAGNGCLLKHAPNVFGCAQTIESLLRDAGLPQHLFSALVIDVRETAALIHDPRIAAVSVTSSVDAGRAVATEAGKALKKCVLELGGSDPFIVLEDADIDKAVAAGVVSRFQNSGQSCIAAKRFIVVDAVYDEFEQKFVEAVGRLKLGDPREPGIDVGPLARLDLRDKLAMQVRRSVEAGATVLCGGEAPEGDGAYFLPTVLVDVKPGMPAWSDELFGPVATLIRARNEADAIAIANATDFGLSASVWTRDIGRGERIAAKQIESGAAFVNEMSKSDPRMPFGGIRNSGYGRELSLFGIREFVNVHAVWVADA